MKRLLILGVLAIAGAAHSQTSAIRVYTCPTAAAAGSDAYNNAQCGSAWSWQTPPARNADLPLVATCASCSWNTLPSPVKWKRPRDVVDAELVAICTSNPAAAIGSRSHSCTPQPFQRADQVLGAGNTPPPAPPVTASIGAEPTTVPYLGTSLIVWSSTNATACEAQGQWSGNLQPAGSMYISGFYVGGVFSVRCTGPGGNATAGVSITVTPPPPVSMAMSIDRNPIEKGESVKVTWSSSNTTSCVTSWPTDPPVPLSGTNITVGPFPDAGQFNLTVACVGILPGPATERSIMLVVAAPASRAPECWPHLRDASRLRAAPLTTPGPVYQLKATWFCANPNGPPRQMSWVTTYAEVAQRISLELAGVDYDEAAAAAECEATCVTLPAGALKDELDAYKTQYTAEQLGVIQ